MLARILGFELNYCLRRPFTQSFLEASAIDRAKDTDSTRVKVRSFEHRCGHVVSRSPRGVTETVLTRKGSLVRPKRYLMIVIGCH